MHYNKTLIYPYYFWYHYLKNQIIKAKLIKSYNDLEAKKTEDRVWYNEKGKLHREDGPAIITVDGVKYWYMNGKNITQQVNIWIDDMDMPKYEFWTDGHRALFKLRFR